MVSDFVQYALQAPNVNHGLETVKANLLPSNFVRQSEGE